MSAKFEDPHVVIFEDWDEENQRRDYVVDHPKSCEWRTRVDPHYTHLDEIEYHCLFQHEVDNIGMAEAMGRTLYETLPSNVYHVRAWVEFYPATYMHPADAVSGLEIVGKMVPVDHDLNPVVITHADRPSGDS